MWLPLSGSLASLKSLVFNSKKVFISSNTENKFMIIASDGLWEFIDNQTVMELVIPAFIRNDVHEAV